MQVACSRCKTQYEVPEEKLARGAVKIRCSRCSSVFLVRKRAAEPAPPPPAGEIRFEDFDFESFHQQPRQNPAEGPAPTATPAQPAAATGPLDEEAPLFDLGEDDIPSLGELDLGDFEDIQKSLGLPEEAPEPDSGPRERLERVQAEDLVSPRREGSFPSGAEGPRLDIQRGPRRSEAKAAPAATVARDRRRSPLAWLVVTAALATAGFTGYNAYRHPEAFTFLRPSKLRSLWQQRTMGAQIGVEALKGYYDDLPGGRKAFVIRGEAVNRSEHPQSLIQIQGNLFGDGARTLASREVFCGNVLSEGELETLPEKVILERLQNEVGDGLSNMDIAAGGRVPFMVFFPSPPDGVKTFSVSVTAARAGSGS